MARFFRSRAEPDSPARRQLGMRSLRGVQQLWVLALVSLTAVAVLGGVTLSRLSTLQSDQALVTERLLPASETLSRAQQLFASATSDFARVVGTPDRSGLVDQLATYSTAATNATAAWNDYERIPPRFASEGKLRAAFDQLSAERTKLLTQILLVSPGAAQQLTRSAVDVSSELARELASLRERVRLAHRCGLAQRQRPHRLRHRRSVDHRRRLVRRAARSLRCGTPDRPCS